MPFIIVINHSKMRKNSVLVHKISPFVILIYLLKVQKHLHEHYIPENQIVSMFKYNIQTLINKFNIGDL